MSLPDTVGVKISSEGVESIAMSPVVRQEMTIEELVRMMLGLTGKDSRRIRDLLLRGSLVAGGSRFRWQGIAADEEDIERLLTRYPDPDPSRPFRRDGCFQIVLRGGPRPLTLEREAGERKRLFRSRSFWEEAMELAANPEYVDYSYKEQADVYRLHLTHEQQAKLAEAAKLLAYSSVEAQVRNGTISSIDLYTRR